MAATSSLDLRNDPQSLTREKALWIRRRSFRMVYEAQLGHPGGDFSAADILAVIYFAVLRFDPGRPADPQRDRFVMSKGHCTGAYYAVLAAAGYFDEAQLDTYMQPLSKAEWPPEPELSAGDRDQYRALGHGLPVAVGIPLPADRRGGFPHFRTHRGRRATGGQQLGAALAAGHRGLENLTLIIDRNRLQQGARTEETSGLDPLDDKWRAFGWHVETVDGHDHEQLRNVLAASPRGRGKPLCVIANTIKGKGVSFMEDNVAWHHGVPTRDQFEQAMRELA